MKLHEALEQAGQAAEADKVASSWVKERPNDVTFTLYLAENAVAKNDLAIAARHYRKSLEIQPDDPVLLNNLAWTLGRLKDPKAIEYAEKSNKLAPDRPDTLNTLGTLLVQKGDTARGIELLRRASQLAPTSASKRLDLAKALIASGQKDAAKKELEELAKLAGKNLEQGAEVEQLMKEI
jgi:Flp pilus assembly protein TadD